MIKSQFNLDTASTSIVAIQTSDLLLPMLIVDVNLSLYILIGDLFLMIAIGSRFIFEN